MFPPFHVTVSCICPGLNSFALRHSAALNKLALHLKHDLAGRAAVRRNRQIYPPALANCVFEAHRAVFGQFDRHLHQLCHQKHSDRAEDETDYNADQRRRARVNGHDRRPGEHGQERDHGLHREQTHRGHVPRAAAVGIVLQITRVRVRQRIQIQVHIPAVRYVQIKPRGIARVHIRAAFPRAARHAHDRLDHKQERRGDGDAVQHAQNIVQTVPPVRHAAAPFPSFTQR